MSLTWWALVGAGALVGLAAGWVAAWVVLYGPASARQPDVSWLVCPDCEAASFDPAGPMPPGGLHCAVCGQPRQ